MFRKKKAQSTLEYIIIFSVVVVAVFAVAYTTLNQRVKNLVNQSAAKVQQAGDKFGTSINP